MKKYRPGHHKILRGALLLTCIKGQCNKGYKYLYGMFKREAGMHYEELII
jgi:hypothetical protein